MNEAEIRHLLETDQLRRRSQDIARARSLAAASEKNAGAVLEIKLTERSSTIVFRELYECVRQLGDAKWWLLGFEPQSHYASLKILADEEIKDRLKLNHIDRFRQARNNANYGGFEITVPQAKEMADFWQTCGKQLLEKIKKEAK